MQLSIPLSFNQVQIVIDGYSRQQRKKNVYISMDLVNLIVPRFLALQSVAHFVPCWKVPIFGLVVAERSDWYKELRFYIEHTDRELLDSKFEFTYVLADIDEYHVHNLLFAQKYRVAIKRKLIRRTSPLILPSPPNKRQKRN